MFAWTHVPMRRPTGVIVAGSTLARTLALRGIGAVLFGLITLIWPAITVLAVALVFGVYALVNGSGLLVGAFRYDAWSRRAPFLAGGLCGIIAGLIALALPGVTAIGLAILVGVWAVATGAFEIAAAIRLRRMLSGTALLWVAGVGALLAGAVVLWQPVAGAWGIALVVGSYALMYGIMLLYLAYHVDRSAYPARRPTAP